MANLSVFCDSTQIFRSSILSSSDNAMPRPPRMGAGNAFSVVDVFIVGAVGVYGAGIGAVAVFVPAASADAAACANSGAAPDVGIVFAAYPFIPGPAGL